MNNEKYYKNLLIGMLIFTFGIIANFVVFMSNDCKMPVHAFYSEHDSQHFSFKEFSEVSYPYLSEILKISSKDHTLYFSIGDTLIFLGAGYLIICILIKWTVIIKDKIKERNEWNLMIQNQF